MKAGAVLLHDNACHHIFKGFIGGLQTLQNALHNSRSPVMNLLSVVNLFPEHRIDRGFNNAFHAFYFFILKILLKQKNKK